MRIRVAMRGWNGAEPAKRMEDVNIGLGIPWIELDGVRVEDIAGFVLNAEKDSLHIPSITIDLIGPVELVYVDEKGEPLPGKGIGGVLTRPGDYNSITQVGPEDVVAVEGAE